MQELKWKGESGEIDHRLVRGESFNKGLSSQDEPMFRPSIKHQLC